MSNGNISSNAVVRSDLDGLFAARQGATERAASLRVAPAVTVESDQFQWHYWNEDGLLETTGTGNAFVKKGYKGLPSRGGMELAAATGSVDFYRYGDTIITQPEVAKFASKGIDPVESYTSKIAAQALRHHARTVGTYLSNSDNYLAANVDSSPLDLSDANSALVEVVQGALGLLEAQGIDLDAVTVAAAYPPAVARELARHNQVHDYKAIAIAEDTTDVAHRTGYAPRGAIEAFWQSAFEIPLTGITFRGQTKTSGTPSFAMNNDIAIICIPQADEDGGFLRTGTLSEEQALGRIVQYTPEKFPDAIGVYMNQAYGLFRPDNAGRFGVLLDGV